MTARNVIPILLPDRVDVCPLAPASMCPNHIGETLPCFLFGRGIECIRRDNDAELTLGAAS